MFPEGEFQGRRWGLPQKPTLCLNPNLRLQNSTTANNEPLDITAYYSSPHMCFKHIELQVHKARNSWHMNTWSTRMQNEYAEFFFNPNKSLNVSDSLQLCKSNLNVYRMQVSLEQHEHLYYSPHVGEDCDDHPITYPLNIFLPLNTPNQEYTIRQQYAKTCPEFFWRYGSNLQRPKSKRCPPRRFKLSTYTCSALSDQLHYICCGKTSFLNRKP